MKGKFSIIICFLSSFFINEIFAQATISNIEKASIELIKRVVPDHAENFKVEFIADENGKDVFELESKDLKIILRGNNGVAVASALNYYLKNFAHCQITWNGSNLNLPKKLPQVKNLIRKVTPYQYRYYLNYCTFNYTMSWWDWERWQWEIDYMALNGINFPLAITGQNSVWSRVYKSLGFTDKELESFFSGPAYFNWFYMGNLDGWGGPLPKSHMKGQEELQKKILERERALGMKPILPAFTGHVPPAFKDKFPKSSLEKTHWSTFSDVYILDPNDPMFTMIGKKFIEEQAKTYGTDHFYTADTFNENTPPSNDSIFLNDISKKVYQSMAEADPKAIWIMQGWLFYHGAKFWKPTQIKALLNAVPDDKMIVLDLWSENHPVWNRTDAYFGKPWIWNMLHNFGGNISLYGRMDEVANSPANTLRDPSSGKMVGIGLTPEAIEQNPAIYELMLENVWNSQPIDLDKWLKTYAHNRYGQKNADAEKAWDILKTTVYSGGILPGGPESIITGRPTLAKSTGGTRPRKNYIPKDLIPAWQHLLNASPQLAQSEGFQYDLVDVTRQVLVNYADSIQQIFAEDYRRKDIASFNKHTATFLEIIEDTDRLLASRKDFLLGKWLHDAKSWGTNSQEKQLYEKNARNLITLWGGKNSRLNEYSCRQWSGMLNGFYKPRWQHYFVYVKAKLQAGEEINQKKFESEMIDWEWEWIHGSEIYPHEAQGDAIAISTELYQKYHAEISKLYQLQL